MFGLGGFVEAYGTAALAGAALGMAAGGFSKGVVGFALPLIAFGTMASFLPVDVAVGLLVLPTLVSNLLQALRNGLGLALGSLVKYRRMIGIMMVTIAISAQLVTWLPERVLFAILGGSITAFGLSQLLGWQPLLPARFKSLAEVAAALVAGFFGGLAGIWGPPLVMYLLAARVPKVELVRVLSLAFLLGSLVLVGAHLRSGALNAVTLPVSAWMVVPTMAAMFLGFGVQDRLDQEVFRKIALAVLVITGANLLRRVFFF
jgi:uncharacterized membrane protein YfcA